MCKVLDKSAPSSLVKLFKYKKEFTQYDLRGSSISLQLPQPKTEKLKKSFSYDGAKIWNSLPANVRNSDTLTIFKNRLNCVKTQLYCNINMPILCYYCDICLGMFDFLLYLCLCNVLSMLVLC